MSNACPVCESQLENRQDHPQGRDVSSFSCPLCGDFTLSRTLESILPSKIQDDTEARAKISFALRKMQQANEDPVLYTNTVTEILKRPLPSVNEQADLLVRWLAENVEGPGKTVWVAAATHRSIIGAKTYDGFAFVLNYLLNSNLVSCDAPESSGYTARAYATLTFAGWEYYEKLHKGEKSYRKAFMAMQFEDKDLDKVYRDVFQPCVQQAGFELYNLAERPPAGLIDNRMRVEIQTSDFLISDLTHDNLGAYWEAGYAEGLGKPVIYTCEKEKFDDAKTHFDTNHHLTIKWDKQSPQEAGEMLKATIRATLPELAKQTDD